MHKLLRSLAVLTFNELITRSQIVHLKSSPDTVHDNSVAAGDEDSLRLVAVDDVGPVAKLSRLLARLLEHSTLLLLLFLLSLHLNESNFNEQNGQKTLF